MNDPYGDPPTDAPPPPPAYADAPAPGGPPHDPYAGAYDHRRCAVCGYNLTGLRPGGTCPECGTHLPAPYQRTLPVSGLAITSMILGICAIPACFFYGLPGVLFGGVGLVLAYYARKQLHTGNYAESSRGFLTAGWVCSIIGAALGLLYMAFWVVFIIFMIRSAPQPTTSPYGPSSPSSPSYPSQWQSVPGGSGVGGFGQPGGPNINTPTPGGIPQGRGLDAHGRPVLHDSLEYGPNGQIRPALPSSVEYGPDGRIRPASPHIPGRGGPTTPGSPGSPGFPGGPAPPSPSPFR